MSIQRSIWCGLLVLVLVLVAAVGCGSKPGPAPATRDSAGSDDAISAAPDPALPSLPTRPLTLGNEPVTSLSVTPNRETASDPLAPPVFTFMRGVATTASGRYDVIWSRDDLAGWPTTETGIRSLPHGSWQAAVARDGDARVMRAGRDDEWRTITSTTEAIEPVAAIGELRYRLLVYGDLARGRLRLARSTDEGTRWRSVDLPVSGPAVVAVDHDGLNAKLAWSSDGATRSLTLQPDHAADKLPKPEPVIEAAMTSSCADGELWIAAGPSLVRVAFGRPIALARPPTAIIACSPDHAIVGYGDGTHELCTGDACAPLTLPAAAAVTTVELVGNIAIAVHYSDGVVTVWRGGAATPTRYRVDTAADRVRLFDFGGTPVLVLFDSAARTTRWATMP